MKSYSAAFLLLALLASRAPAELVVGSGSTHSTQFGFREAYGWSPSTLYRDGLPIMRVTSGNGSVIKLADVEWTGSWHGQEVVEQTDLHVDGEEAAVADPASYQVESAVFTRTTVLGDAYRLTHQSTITSRGMDEQAHFTGINPAKTVEVFYGWLGTRENRLSHWAAFDFKQRLLATGTTTANSLVEVPMPVGTMAVAQYDPLAGNGILTRWEAPGGSQAHLRAIIHDRPEDNKLYFRLLEREGRPADQDFTITQSLRFFEASSDGWLASAAAAYVPIGDMTGNWRIDNFDISAFELALADRESFAARYPTALYPDRRGDVNGDGVFDNYDLSAFQELVAQVTATRAVSSASVMAVPEPSAWALAVTALGAVFFCRGRRRS